MTVSRARAETRRVGTAEESAKGSPKPRATASKSASTSASTLTIVWSVPRACATDAAWGDSSYAPSRNPIEKVFGGRSINRDI